LQYAVAVSSDGSYITTQVACDRFNDAIKVRGIGGDEWMLRAGWPRDFRFSGTRYYSLSQDTFSSYTKFQLRQVRRDLEVKYSLQFYVDGLDLRRDRRCDVLSGHKALARTDLASEHAGYGDHWIVSSQEVGGQMIGPVYCYDYTGRRWNTLEGLEINRRFARLFAAPYVAR
jgi:hypothetical protein